MNYSITDVETGTNGIGRRMLWIGGSLRIGDILERYAKLKDEYGLNAYQIAYYVGMSETSLSRVFTRKHKAQTSTLIALDVALTEWEKYLRESEDE